MSEEVESSGLRTDSAKKPVQRLGFLAGSFTVPDDFNQMAYGEIYLLFTDQDRHSNAELEKPYQSN